MRIGSCQDACSLFGFVHATPLCPSQEEALLGSKAADLPGISLRAAFKCLVRELQPSIVSDVFAERQFAVYLDVVHRRVLRILLHKAGGPLLVVLAILRGPPVSH